jgi:hypothetical protein
MSYFLLCIFVNLACVGIAYWADISTQKHINKGYEDAIKKL